MQWPKTQWPNNVYTYSDDDARVTAEALKIMERVDTWTRFKVRCTRWIKKDELDQFYRGHCLPPCSIYGLAALLLLDEVDYSRVRLEELITVIRDAPVSVLPLREAVLTTQGLKPRVRRPPGPLQKALIAQPGASTACAKNGGQPHVPLGLGAWAAFRFCTHESAPILTHDEIIQEGCTCSWWGAEQLARFFLASSAQLGHWDYPLTYPLHAPTPLSLQTRDALLARILREDLSSASLVVVADAYALAHAPKAPEIARRAAAAVLLIGKLCEAHKLLLPWTVAAPPGPSPESVP